MVCRMSQDALPLGFHKENTQRDQIQPADGIWETHRAHTLPKACLESIDTSRGREDRALKMSRVRDRMLPVLLPWQSRNDIHTCKLADEAQHTPQAPARYTALGANSRRQAGQMYTSSTGRRALHARRVVFTAINRVCACHHGNHANA